MTALTKLDFAPAPTANPEATRLAEADRDALNRLRLAALRCRAAARLDLFRACAMLGADREATTPAFAEALLRTLDQGLNEAPVFHAPGADDLSFDERWLMSLIGALRADDMPSATFLINSRIAQPARRSLGFLAARVAHGIDSLE